MQSPSPNDARIAEIAKIAETKSDIVALQQHVKEVIEGEVFKGSHRSVQFLQYIVDQAIAGHCESLKERVIGMELFGRSASYDTGDDAIVRVTASDVRRRLLDTTEGTGPPQNSGSHCLQGHTSQKLRASQMGLQLVTTKSCIQTRTSVATIRQSSILNFRRSHRSQLSMTPAFFKYLLPQCWAFRSECG